MGLAAHTDSTLLTILYQNNTSGLQVLREGIGWVTVPPIPGGLVINIGDLLHILSNGLYPSVLHRAVVNRTKHRLSMAYLYGPPSSVKISPLSKLVGPNQPCSQFLHFLLVFFYYITGKKENENRNQKKVERKGKKIKILCKTVKMYHYGV